MTFHLLPPDDLSDSLTIKSPLISIPPEWPLIFIAPWMTSKIFTPEWPLMCFTPSYLSDFLSPEWPLRYHTPEWPLSFLTPWVTWFLTPRLTSDFQPCEWPLISYPLSDLSVCCRPATAPHWECCFQIHYLHQCIYNTRSYLHWHQGAPSFHLYLFIPSNPLPMAKIY